MAVAQKATIVENQAQVATPSPLVAVPARAGTDSAPRQLRDAAMAFLRLLVPCADLMVLATTGLLVLGMDGLAVQDSSTLLSVLGLYLALSLGLGLNGRKVMQNLRLSALAPLLAGLAAFGGGLLLAKGLAVTPPAPQPELWVTGSLASLVLFRIGLCLFLNHHPVAARWQQTVGFIGDVRDIAQLFSTLPGQGRLPFRLAGYYTLQPKADYALSSMTHLGALSDQPYLRLDQRIDRMVVVTDAFDPARLDQIMVRLSALSCPVDLCLLPLVGQAGTADAPLAHCRMVPLREAALAPRQAIHKRLFDIFASSAAILVLSPVLLGAALAVRLSSPGPVLFCQPRWGRDGQTFQIFKFRSMYVNQCDTGRGTVAQATRHDPRITPVGRILRSTSIDELPQLFNVLRGDMSLIGFRPHAVAHNEEYALKVRHYIDRHQMRPGLSGWAQVHGYRGETPQVHLMQKRIDYDVDYVRNWSLWLDIKIIFKTVGLILSRKNAW